MADAGAGAARGARISAACRHRGGGEAWRACGTWTIAPMIRIVVFLVLTVAFAKYVAIWLADHPAEVSITWLGYHAEPPIGIVFAAVAAVACAAGLLWSLIRLLVRAPRPVARPMAHRRAPRGHHPID